MLPTILLSLISFGLILGGLATFNPFLLALSLPFFLYLLTGLYNPRHKSNLIFDRSLSAQRAVPGDRVTISVTVTNHGPGLEALLIEDIIPPRIKVIESNNRHLINLETNESFTWSYHIIGQRGSYSFNTIHAETRSLLGLAPVKREYPTIGTLLVLPEIHPLKRVTIRPHWTRIYTGEIPSRSGGQGTDFFGIRHYQPGDPPTKINWLASARHPGKFFSNEFEQDKVSDVGIILDGRERVNTISTKKSIFEYTVQAAASLAAAFIHQGDRVSLLNYGKYLEWTIPGYGKYQLERILRALAVAKPGESLVFSYLEYIPTQIFPPNSQIVLISPLAPDDAEVLLQIRARGYQLLLVSPDPIGYESSFLPATPESKLAARILHLERNLLLGSLLRGGIQVLDWDVTRPFEHVVHTIQRSPGTFHASVSH